MNIGAFFKSIFDAVAKFFDWRNEADRRKEEAIKKNENRQEKLRIQLEDAKARGDFDTVDRIRSGLRDEETN